MSKTPIKVYFNPKTEELLDSDGQVIKNDAQTPHTRLTEKGVINIQLVTDYDDETETFTKFDELITGMTARALVDNDYSNPEIVRTFVTGSGNWTLSGSGTNEYYYTAAVNSEPVNVYENAAAMAAGTVGSLAAGEWDYADNDSIGENRVYVRLSDDTDPDSKALGYMTYLLASGTYTPLFIDSQEFNNANTWYDETTGLYRNPVLEDGELTFEYNANTDSYYDRITADATAAAKGYARTTLQIPLYEAGSGEHFDTYEFDFFSYNRYLPDDQIKLDVSVLVVYSKAEVDAIAAGKMDKPSPSVTPGNVAVFAADGVNVEDGGALPAGGGDVSGPASSTDNALPRFDGAGGKTIQAGQTIEDDSGNVTVNGDLAANSATFDDATVDDDAYAAGWNGDFTVPTKNAVYDEMETKLTEDFSGLTVKAAADGTEVLAINDGGAIKQMTAQKIVDKAIADFPDVDVQNGINTPAEDIDNDDDGVQITAQRTKDTAPATVVVLNHFDGVAGDNSIEDDSTFGHTAALEGAPVLSTAQKYAEGYGTVLSLPGTAGYYYPTTNFDPGAGEFAFSAKAYIADADKNKTMTFLYIANHVAATDKVIEVYLEGGYLKYRIGTDTGSGDWTDSDSVEVVTAGYLTPDDWNSLVFQRYGDELQVGLNGYVLMRLSMTGKTLNTPGAGDRIRFGHSLDAAAAAENFFFGYFDEVILLDGDNLIDITTNGPTPTTFTDVSEEWHVTKVYDIDPNKTVPASALDFVREFTASPVNMKSTGETQWYTVPYGKVLYIERFDIILEGASAIASQPEITIGHDTDDDAYVVQQALDSSLNAQYERQAFDVITDGLVAGKSVEITVKVGAGGTTYTAYVGFVGFLRDA